MNLQILVSTLNSDPHKLVKKMHIDSDAIIINQCDKNSQEKFTYKKHSIYVFNTTERGIGKSRKMALALADADVVLFADDDEIMADNYTNKILQSFQNNKKSDFFIFEIGSKTNFKSRHSGRVHWWNILKYGTTRFAVKRSSLLDSEITFDERFGAAEYGHGEDSIFLHDCLKAGLTIVKSNANIATFSENKSTWFNGYDKKYYQDTGALFARLYGIFSPILLLASLFRRKTKIRNIIQAFNGSFRYLKNNKLKSFFKNVSPSSLLITLFLIYFIPSTISIPSSISTIVRVFIFVTIFIIAFIRFLLSKKKNIPLLIIIPITLLTLVSIISWITNENMSFSKNVIEFFFLPIATLFCFLLFFYDYKMTKNEFKKICIFTVTLCLISCIYSLISEYNLFQKLLTASGGYSVKFQSFFDNRNTFSIIIFMGIFSNLCLSLYKKSPLKKILNILTLLLFVFFLLLTMSRTTIAATIVLFIIFVFLLMYEKPYLQKRIIISMLIVLSAVSILFIIPFTREYIFSNFIRATSGITHRDSIYEYGITYFTTHNQFIGSGFIKPHQELESLLNYKGFHNSFLSILIIYGILGLISYILFFTKSILNIRIITKKDKSLGIMLAAFMLTYMLISCFESYVPFLTTPPILLITTFLIFSPLYLSNFYKMKNSKIALNFQKKNKNDLVSIIVPAYNIESFIERCLKSILNQTYKEIEIIVIDDCSSDSTGKICDIISKNDARITVLHNKTNLGLSKTRNLGLKKAKGKYITFVDGDDWVMPTFIEVGYNLAIATQSDIAAIGYYKDYNNRNLICTYSAQSIMLSKEQSLTALLKAGFNGYTCNKLYAKDIIRDNYFDSKTSNREDQLFNAQIFVRNARISYLPIPLYHYTQRDNSLIGDKYNYNKKLLLHIDTLQKIIKIYEKYLPSQVPELRYILLKTCFNLEYRIHRSKINNDFATQKIQKTISKNYSNALNSNISFVKKANLFISSHFPIIIGKIKHEVLKK